MKKKSRTTPMMSQYLSIKKEYPDAILLFRMGDFYETFLDDARTASRVLGIALTSRGKEGGKDIPLAGIPHHAAETYIARLVRAGLKVAICEQTEDPRQARGLVRRGVVEVITPGTITSALLLDEKENNFLAAIAEGDGRWGIARADLSTGEFSVSEVEAEDLLDELTRFSPSEILIAKGMAGAKAGAKIKERLPGASFTEMDDWLFLSDAAEDTLKDHFKVSSLEGFGVAGMPLAVGAAGAVITYLRQTQKRLLPHIGRLGVHRKTVYMEIDENSLSNLEILKPLHAEDKDASLVNVLDRTLTAMGGRTLRAWLRLPLVDTKAIGERLEAVDELVGDEVRRRDLREALCSMSDLERLIARVCTERAGPRDLVAVKESLGLLPRIRDILEGSVSVLLGRAAAGLPDLSEVRAVIDKSIKEGAPVNFKQGEVIRAGYDERLDELRDLTSNARKYILGLQQKERDKTGIEKLRIGYNKVFGYYIEVTKANISRVPPDYIRKQTLVNAERYITEELKEKEAEILKADETATRLEESLFKDIRSEVAQATADIQAAARTVAELDVLASFAEAAGEGDYVRPVVRDERRIEIREGRHPVVERFLGEETFVPNDVLFDDDNQLLVITGPNMAGKSTYLRQVALIVIMAQVGSFVPAASAEVGVVDKVFTRIGATDRVARGQSTFLVEMVETANILNNSTERSLVLLDEVGRGTSTFDGLSIAWAVVEYLHDNDRVRPLTLFATHYHQLTDLAAILPRVKNYNIQVKEYGDSIVFLRKIVEGGTDRSYGIQVAKLAGLPQIVIDRAREVLANIEEDEYSVGEIPRIARGEHSPVAGEVQLGLWDAETELMKRLRGLDLNNMTPLQALEELMALRKMASPRDDGPEEETHGEY
ncbi:MAG: DNA mismatch repair protein MutS [bacterium]|jgi:DNA mismatch repair protein MutS